MAFVGDMGATAAMTPIARMTTPGGTLTYDTDGITLLKTDTGTVTPILRPNIANLRFTMSVDQAGVLQAMVVGVAAGANADVGTLVTAAPGANEHGIPANFGPGRGNWTVNDFSRLRATVDLMLATPGAVTNVGMANVTAFSLPAGNISILVRNFSELEINGLIVNLEWRHSMVIG